MSEYSTSINFESGLPTMWSEESIGRIFSSNGADFTTVFVAPDGLFLLLNITAPPISAPAIMIATGTVSTF